VNDIPRSLEEAGARLRQERARLGLNQAEFAALGGVKRNSQVAYEAGRIAVPADYLLRLSGQGVDIGFVLTGRREDGSLGLWETRLIENFRRMTDQGRDAIISISDALVSRPPSELRETRPQTLHSPGLDYKPLDE
jgi:transcriptional regulator with XRE-family HTH domain